MTDLAALHAASAVVLILIGVGIGYLLGRDDSRSVAELHKRPGSRWP